jgi:hypothetical protein
MLNRSRHQSGARGKCLLKWTGAVIFPGPAFWRAITLTYICLKARVIRMRFCRALCLATIVICAGYCLCLAQEHPENPVPLPYLCNFARVYHLETGSYLSVRSGPSTRFSRIDRLTAGTAVYTCDEQGEWVKIFYGGPNTPCGSESGNGLDARRVATCKSGWLNRKWIDVISG